MRRIYKYEVPSYGDVIQCHPIAHFLDCQIQGQGAKQVVFWAVVEADEPKKNYQVTVAMTGSEYRKDFGMHIGTVQHSPGYVEHIFVREL